MLRIHTRSLALICALLLSACGASALTPPVVGSGNTTTKALTATGEFRAVRVDGGITVEITDGGEPSFSVEADDNLVPLLLTDVKDGTLRLWTETPWQTKTGFRVRIGGRALTSVSAYGATRVRADVLRGDAIDVVGNGSADVQVGEVVAKKVKADMRGASKLKVAGRGVESLRILAGDSAKVEAAVDCASVEISAQGAAVVTGVTTRTANVLAAGAVKVDLDCEKVLTLDVTGASSLRWGGDPELHGNYGAGTSVGPRNR